MMLVNESYPNSWHKHAFHAMGCEMALWLETADSNEAATAFAQVEALFETNEQALSRFRPDSELSQLNARSGRWVVVSDLMWDVLTLALGMAAITNGRFDPTTLNALEQYGYTVSFEQLKRTDRTGQVPNFAPQPGRWTAVELDVVRQAVYLPHGLRVDLGGIAKGYTAQQAVDLLAAWGPCLVDAGGDLAAGDAPVGQPGWPVAISAPWTSDDVEPPDLFTLWLANQALATSGVDYRNWQQNGRTAHHLIDPATGQPAVTDGLTVSIMGDDAAQTEAWATATLVAGSDAGMEALLDADLAGLMVLRNGRILVTPPMHQHIQMLATA
ncbi:MAG: FAD:protein FMN transferase [Anaerolineae bacterium]